MSTHEAAAVIRRSEVSWVPDVLNMVALVVQLRTGKTVKCLVTAVGVTVVRRKGFPGEHPSYTAA